MVSTSPRKQLEVINSMHESLVKTRQLHSNNPRKDMEHKKSERPTSSSEVHKFDSLTFLACENYETPKFSKAGMIAHMTQIVHNDILVKELSAHGHSKCKCGTSSAKKKRKTIN